MAAPRLDPAGTLRHARPELRTQAASLGVVVVPHFRRLAPPRRFMPARRDHIRKGSPVPARPGDGRWRI